MGLALPHQGMPASQRPGGLPIHAFMTAAVLPEREIVPLRTRWRDDKLIVATLVLGPLLCVIALVLALALPAPKPPGPVAKPAAGAVKK
jgi:type VI secretion system protein ImpL